MGIFKNLKNTMSEAAELTKTAKELQAEQGDGGGMLGLGGAAQMMSDANSMLKDMQEQQARAARLMSVGLVGQASIKALRDTGLQVNNQPRFEIDLDVTVPDRDPYPATITQVVALAVLPQFQIGATMPVHVDPDDPSILMIG